MKNLLKIKLLLLFWCMGLMSTLIAQTNSDVQLANQLFSSGNYQKSSQIYAKLYSKYKSANYYHKLLDCYFAIDEMKLAEKLIKKHSKKYTNNITVKIDYAHLFFLLGEEKKAKKKFDEVFERLNSNAQYVSVVAKKLTKYGYLEEAIVAYEIGLKNPSKNTYRFSLARLYSQMNDLEMMYKTYLDLVINNKVYLQNVKNIIGRTISKDADDENNQLLKGILIQKTQKSNDASIGDLLIWLFIQEKNFEAAFDQEKSMDQRFNLGQKKIFELASISRKNKAFGVALDCYQYIIEIGSDSAYYLDAQLAAITVKKERLENAVYTTKEDWQELEESYDKLLNEIGIRSQTVLLVRDMAEIQAFRLHNTEQASKTIQTIQNFPTAAAEDLARCKLLQADIQLLKNEIWESILSYSQVIKAYKNDVLGHEAKYRRAKISYYQGDFDWAQAQLDVLKKSTAKLIANNAMELSLLIQDNLNLDTTTTTMEIFSRADLLVYQNKLDEAYSTLDTIVIDYQGHSLVDEAIFRQYEIKSQQGAYKDASELLDQIITFYSFDILADDAKFAQAQLQEIHFENQEQASELYQEIISKHPDSFYVSESRKRYRILRGE
ncbi:hypothetical protein N9Y06_00455 [Flavobacteriales bacterium]|nr:hypothetical protein [Flavobacteriales bacterium]